MTVEVGPVGAETVARLKRDGYSVFRGRQSWRVQATSPLLGSTSLWAQANAIAANVVRDYSLSALTDPPIFMLRDPDATLDASAHRVIEDAQRADDPEPLEHPHLKWYQHDLGWDLRERRRGFPGFRG